MKKCLIPFAVLISLGHAVTAQSSRSWISDGVDINWSNPNNWDPSGVPDNNGRQGRFQNDDGGSNVVNVDGNFTVNRFSFSDTGSLTSGYTLNGSSTITVDVNNSSTFTQGIGYSAEQGSGGSSFTHVINANVAANNTGTGFTGLISGTSGNVVGGGITFNGTLTATTRINFGGVSGTTTTINGALINNGDLRMGTSGTVLIAGSGVSSGSGEIEMRDGTLDLARASALSVSEIRFRSADLLLNANAAVIGTANVRVQSDTSTLGVFGVDNEFGTLRLDSATLIVDFNNIGSGSIAFSDSSAMAWSSSGNFEIVNFDPATNSIRFGNSDSALTASQLERMTMNGNSGLFLDSSGFVVIPEPQVAALFSAVLAFLAVFLMRRKNK